jgi:hypothetical protein
VLRDIKYAKTYLDRAWTKWFVHDSISAHVADNIYFEKSIEATQVCEISVPQQIPMKFTIGICQWTTIPHFYF